MHDVINQPNHYIGLEGLEVRDIQKQFVPKYLEYSGIVACDMANVIKYVLRAPQKNGVEDLKKARKYLDWAIDDLESRK